VILLISASRVARITGVNHWHPGLKVFDFYVENHVIFFL
jgi:hypothetical protein